MNKFEELKKKYDDAVTTYDDIERVYREISHKRMSAEMEIESVLLNTVVAILEDVTGRSVNLQKGVNVSYLGTDGVLIIGKVKSYAILLEFHELTKSGKVSAKKKFYVEFYYNRKTGIMTFDEEFFGTPEEVVEFLKTYDRIKFK